MILSYLQDGSGSIDKNELRSLFVDLFPHFNRYVHAQRLLIYADTV